MSTIDYWVVLGDVLAESEDERAAVQAPPVLAPRPLSLSTVRQQALGSRDAEPAGAATPKMAQLYATLSSAPHSARFPAPGRGVGLIRTFAQPLASPAKSLPIAAKAGADEETKAAPPPAARERKERTTMMMPDKKCRVCYDCDAPFTVIKRRHHCRMCGQVFCGKCSAQRIDGRQITGESLVRVCDACAALYSNRQNVLAAAVQPGGATAAGNGAGGDGAAAHVASTSASAASAAAASTPPAAPFSAGTTPGTTPRSSVSRAPHRARCLSNVMPQTSVNFESYVTALRVDGARRSGGADALTLATLVEGPDSSDLAELVATAASASTPTASVAPPAAAARADSPQLASFGGESGESVRDTCQLHADALQRYSRMRLRATIVAMIDRSGELAALSAARRSEWASVVTNLVAQAAADIGAHQPSMDVRDYFKVKVIAGGAIDECRVVHGAVFRRDLADRKMVRSIDNADLLLLACAIQHDRNMKISNLDQLVEQEERHMEIKVGMITALRPHVVLVEENVSQVSS